MTTPKTQTKEEPAHDQPAEDQPAEDQPAEDQPAQAQSALPHDNTDISMVPHAPKVPKTLIEKEKTRRLIVVLERCCLETYKVGKNQDARYQLLNCDDHQGILKRLGRDITDARPDITHQCLLTLLDSPLNKAGLLQVYIHTARNVLIEVNPHVRIPRTFKRFAGLMVQLLHKLTIRSVNGTEKLLRVIKNPVTDHLPMNCRKLAFSFDAPTVRLSEYLPTIPADYSICVSIGAMAHGTDNFADAYVDEKIGISQYPLSASVACGKMCCALEELWDVLVHSDETLTGGGSRDIMDTTLCPHNMCILHLSTTFTG
ncbi:Alpha/beta knot methyltransferase [Jimgerdemannia flammicorona]|uniref:Alpha/beta knot methyltransferase n=1 Tax=Jimgerdemannia flammicorona TaxID=994334 RepID=A0A433QXB1_9FUNG|nr:Alpha/beta knot methyltransferase [Jimgerdemannia flammicorona]